MNNFTLDADSGTSQTVENGNTLKIAGGTLISTSVAGVGGGIAAGVAAGALLVFGLFGAILGGLFGG